MIGTIISVIIGGMISLATSLMMQRRDFKQRKEEEYRNQLFKAYDDLWSALSQYNSDCTRIATYDVNLKNAREISAECQTAFFRLQFVFRKPLLITDNHLQDVLAQIRQLNVIMGENILKQANSGTTGPIDTDFPLYAVMGLEGLGEA